MTGSVTSNREAVLQLSVRGPAAPETEISAVLDTGYTGTLTLSPSMVAALVLPFFGSRRVMLGDGSEVALNIHEATVIWHGQPRLVQVLATDGGALFGMSMIYGSRVILDAVDGGQITITPIP